MVLYTLGSLQLDPAMGAKVCLMVIVVA